jgi:hypothetical protein
VVRVAVAPVDADERPLALAELDRVVVLEATPEHPAISTTHTSTTPRMGQLRYNRASAAIADRLGTAVLATHQTAWTRTADSGDPQGAVLTASQFTPPG